MAYESDPSLRFSDAARRISASSVREILKLTEQPDFISLAGGLPASEGLPVDMLPYLMTSALEDREFGPRYAANYTVTEGIQPFREIGATYCRSLGASVENVNSVLVNSGSQETLDLVGRLFINPGDKVAVEAPTYVGALQTWRGQGADFVTIQTDDDGMIPESLNEVLQAHNVKFVYTIPNFQNPTGRTIPFERRKAIAHLLEKHDALLFEDDPYGDLRYKGDHIVPIQSLAPDRVIYTHSLSKVLMPSMRLAVVVVPEPYVRKLVEIKQAANVATGGLVQSIAGVYIRDGYLQTHLQKIVPLYRERRDAMQEELRRYMPSEWKWSSPDGGMFVFGEGNDQTDTVELLQRVVEQKVAFVPARDFYPSGGGEHAMRLNFSYCDVATIQEGVQRLASVMAPSGQVYPAPEGQIV
jgi:2-aminoadipate transaminase